MTSSRLIPAITLAILALLCFLPMASAQQGQNPCSLAGAPAFGLRTPLVNGAQMGIPFIPATHGAPPAIGDGSCPAPVNPGMGGPPTLIPSNPYQPPAIGGSTYVLPYNTATTSMPGQLGPSLQVPPPPSTPGCDPGLVHSNGNNGYYPPVTSTYINPGGGITAYAPTQKWGGQTSRDFGRFKDRGTRSYDFGQPACYGQSSYDGPYQQLPYATSTQDLYGMRGYARGGSTTMTIAPY